MSGSKKKTHLEKAAAGAAAPVRALVLFRCDPCRIECTEELDVHHAPEGGLKINAPGCEKCAQQRRIVNVYRVGDDAPQVEQPVRRGDARDWRFAMGASGIPTNVQANLTAAITKAGQRSTPKTASGAQYLSSI